MWRLYNLETKQYLVDEYNETISFFSGHTMIDYYNIACKNMINVVIRKVEL